MKSKLIKHIGLLLAAALSFSAVSVTALAISSTRASDEVAEVQAADHYTPTTTYEVSNTSAKLSTYYDGLSSLSSSALLTQLRTLDSNKRHSFSYGNMGAYAQGSTSNTYSKSPFIYTDYVTSTNTDSNGMPYSTTISSFYTGGSIGSSGPNWNKEHVWPKSLGGSNVENNLLMPRPTLQSENSSRGNSPFVEGMNSSSGGWDPETAFSSNYFPGIRGECARIIFYCVVASSSLNLVDSTSTNSSTMGKISDLMKWHYAEPPTQREINRNNGAQYIQGNRNPFVDHPEYVTKIWGTQNSSVPGSSSTIASYCTSHESTYTNWVPGSSSSGSTPSTDPSATITGSSSVTVGSSISLTAALSNVTSTSLVAWESSDTSKATVTKGTTSTTSSVASVTGVAAGSVTIRCKYNGTIIGSKSITVTSSSSGGSGAETFEKVSSISEGDYLIVYETNSVAFDGSLTNLDSTPNTISVTIANSKIEATSTTKASAFTFTKSGDNYTIKSKSGYYIGRTANSNGIDSSTSTSYTNTISISNGNATIASSGGKSLLFNTASNQLKFRYLTNGGSIQLYKYSGSSSGSDTPEKVLDSISATYTGEDIYVGDTLDESAFTVTASYTDSTTYPNETVTGWTVSGFDSDEAGTNTVTITYQGETCTVDLTILEASVVPTGDGGEASWTAGNQGYSDTADVTSDTFDDNQNISVAFSVGSNGNSNSPKYYTSGSAVRCYVGNTITITSTKSNIKSIVLTFADNGGKTKSNITADSGTMSSDYTTWSASGNSYQASVILTLSTSAQRRIAGITVSYYGASNFSEDFLTNITCNGGSTAPSVSNWNSMRDNKYSLLFDADKTTLAGATASESGTVIEQAMARYDFIIGKYNKQSVVYANYISRSGSGIIAHNSLSIDTSTATIIIIATSMAAITIIGGALILKRKEQ